MSEYCSSVCECRLLTKFNWFELKKASLMCYMDGQLEQSTLKVGASSNIGLVSEGLIIFPWRYREA